METTLQKFGLTKTETQIYLALLENQQLSGQEIRKITQIANSRVYSSLDSLIDKGLVTYFITAKHKVFSAVDPQILINISEERKKEIENIIPQLKSIQSISSNKTSSAVFEGFQGFKNALYKMAEQCRENEEVRIIGFSNQAYENKKLQYLLKSVNKISKEKNNKFKMILDSENNIFEKDRLSEGFTEIRYMPKGFVSPAAIDIFQDYVYIFMWGENPYVFMIKNEEI